jgi:GAF domain-containing protein
VIGATVEYPHEFVEELLGLSHMIVGDRGIEPVLHRVAELAKLQLDGCDLASVTVVHSDVPTTAVATDGVAPVIDAAQYESGEGPCLDAYRYGSALRIDDTLQEQRWPAFSRAAAEHGVRSVVSLPLIASDQRIGSLNLYSRRPQGLTEDDQIAGLLVAHAAATLANAQAYWAAHTLSEQLQTALASRSVIEQAKGILMYEHHCDADEAFEILKRESQSSNRKLRDVASDMVNRASVREPDGR